MRVVRVLPVFLFLLGLVGMTMAGPSRGMADASLLAARDVEIALDLEDDTALFVLGNTLFAVYHELGHALIDLLELPVIGREEDAADGFAAMMMIPPSPDPIRDELIIAVADGWRLQGDRVGGDRHARPTWAEHALDEQRYYAVICWLVGSDQEGFFDLAEESGMPIQRIKSCAGDFQRLKASWQDLLRRHAWTTPNGAQGHQVGGRLAVTFDPPDPEDAEAFAWAHFGNVVAGSVAALDRNLTLPDDVIVRFRSCNDANAYWHAAHGEVRICYELVEDFLNLLGG